MTILATAEALSGELESASQSKDWPRLLLLDERVAHLLVSIAKQKLSSDCVQSLKLLQQSHQRAIQRCQAYQQVLKADMEQMRNRQEGISAYAAAAIHAYQDMAQEEGR
ncbi:putative flagellar protein lafD [Yersinia pseudotuberculosis]|uniref:hypothetical protein n=1 Tax=Yersinia pseudotuberculosis TaxID=633 RepID=UPI0005AD2F77|nr:hypothetical protein [Yersinia pseudotuberculosis]AJJ06693.1 putative flagellar protein lafD [Yersinia pseudotuberculosis]MBO1556256.1 flagellar protein lafD [Yersinia pseudotuberculosis]MBO1562501.1 flagellar protein lafD [Yersinia pseudotuberculosis]CNL26862.1 putative flagellar protein lafD [Yersinia pseudotuberculosis]